MATDISERCLELKKALELKVHKKSLEGNCGVQSAIA